MATAKPVAAGDTLTCQVCGLSLVVDDVCGCAEAHEIICCSTPMTVQPRAAQETKAARAKPKPKAAAKARVSAKPKARARAKK